MKRTNLYKEDYALEIFSSQSFLTINKSLLKHYGPDISIFLSSLIDKYKFFLNRDDLKDGEWFYLIHKIQIEQTGLTLKKIRTCKNILVEDNILKISRFGIPSKEWYKLDLVKLLSIVGSTTKRLARSKQAQLARSKQARLYNKTKFIKKEKIIKKDKKEFLSYFPVKWQNNAPFQFAIDEFINHRKEKKKPLTKAACIRIANKFSKYDISICIDAIYRSIESGWTGVFPEAEKNYSKEKFYNNADNEPASDFLHPDWKIDD